MNELLRKRIDRRLESLTDEVGYRVLDYIEFLDSKYGSRDRKDTMFDKIADGVEDTLRATRVPAAAIRGTMGAVGSAATLMDRLANAGRSAVSELGKTLNELGQPVDTDAEAATAADTPTPAEAQEPETEPADSPDDVPDQEDAPSEEGPEATG